MKIPASAKGTFLLAVTFTAGVAIGVVYERRQGATAVAVTGPHDHMQHLTRELDLDAAQQRTIGEILSRGQANVDSTWHAMQPHMQAMLESTQQEIARVLRPDQLVKYQKMMSAHAGGHH